MYKEASFRKGNTTHPAINEMLRKLNFVKIITSKVLADYLCADLNCALRVYLDGACEVGKIKRQNCIAEIPCKEIPREMQYFWISKDAIRKHCENGEYGGELIHLIDEVTSEVEAFALSEHQKLWRKNIL